MTSIALASVVDWSGFSRAVRTLRAERVPPERVRWRIAGEGGDDLFDSEPARDAWALAEAPALNLPKAFVDAAREVFLNADAERLPLLHRLVLRIADDARAWADPLHADRLQFDRLQREVRREIHKMHAFVRFRRIEGAAASDDPSSADFDDAFVQALDEAFEESAPGRSGAAPRPAAGAPAPLAVRHVAWFEPGHHVLEAAAPFFARRFATMRWAILTPRVSVEWDGRALAFGPGAQRAEAPPADAGEALWLAYYGSIFNPARVKVAMMKKEMPVRFWKNLPEASAIGSLLADAPRRAQRMVDAGGALRDRRRGRVEVDVRVPTPGLPAAGLDDLRRLAARCRDCPAAEASTQTVFGEGSARARLMIVGEQPGDQEDLRGRPFQGPAGQLLHEAFEQLGWDARALYLTNAVKHFHHELRGKHRIHKTPGQQEAAACLHWLEAEIVALRPEAIVALGATAARSLLGRDVAVLANEGPWLARGDGVPVLVCLHPAAVLRADSGRQTTLRQHWIETLRLAAPFALASADDFVGRVEANADPAAESPAAAVLRELAGLPT